MQRAFRTPISYFGGLLLLSLWLHSIFFVFVIFYFYNNNRLYSSLLIVNVVALLIDQYVVNERLQLRIVTRSVFNDSSRTFVFLAHQQCFIGHSWLMVFIFFNVMLLRWRLRRSRCHSLAFSLVIDEKERRNFLKLRVKFAFVVGGVYTIHNTERIE